MRPHVRRFVLRGFLALVVSASLAAVILIPAAANVNVSKSGWAWANPTPQGRTLTDIAFSGGTGYAVGFGGTALSTRDGGQSWTGLTTGTAVNLERVQAVGASTVVVGGGGGCVTRISDNAGALFKRIFNVAESGCPEPVAAFSFITGHVGFLLLKNGAVELTSDGGETFSRRTGIPGTAASSGGGAMVGTDVHFFTPSAGIAFVSDPNSVASAAYSTPDGGVSWVPVSLPLGSRVTSVHFVDETTGYAIGPGTLLRTDDGGHTWKAQAIAGGTSFSSIDCSSAKTCLLTVAGGNELIETQDGGATDVVKTTSSSLIYSAAYASVNRIVAVGESGATVVSNDGGATFASASLDVGGQYNRLRRGPGAMLLAPGAGGDLAISLDGGQSWQVITTQTSQELVDASFGTSTLGYALDAGGGLQRTTNGGTSWQTLSPGTTRHAAAVAAIGERTALLIGPVGISRAVNGGPFEPASGPVVRSATVSDYQLLGATVFAFGVGTHTLIRSTNEGGRWSAINLPLQGKQNKRKKLKARPGVSIRGVAFTSATSGMVLDTEGRLWATRDGGREWREILAGATGQGLQLAFATPTEGFMSVRGFAGDASDAYVMRTANGGASWHPQEITAGSIPQGGLVAASGADAAVLVDGSSVKGEPLRRLLFTTQTGGDVSGSAPPLTLSSSTRTLVKRKLKATHGAVRISGTLRGALGGETIVVARRDLAGGPWQEQRVVAGANGGSFGTNWHVTRSSVFVAQWAGDSGRPGQGTPVLEVLVK
jgi:photosystem II stability/assembly factor-like uncharacterized protein